MIAFHVEINMRGTKTPNRVKQMIREKRLFSTFTRTRYDPHGIKNESRIDNELPNRSQTTSMLDTQHATPAPDQKTKIATTNRFQNVGGASSLGGVEVSCSPSKRGTSKSLSSTVITVLALSFQDRRMMSRAGIVNIGNASVMVKAKQSRPINNSGSLSSNDSNMLPVICPSGVQAAYRDPEKPITM